MNTIHESVAHRHSQECLAPVASVQLASGLVVAAIGWSRCTSMTDGAPLAGTMTQTSKWYPAPNGYTIHDHGGVPFAHMPGEPCAFPGGVT